MTQRLFTALPAFFAIGLVGCATVAPSTNATGATAGSGATAATGQGGAAAGGTGAKASGGNSAKAGGASGKGGSGAAPSAGGKAGASGSGGSLPATGGAVGTGGSAAGTASGATGGKIAVGGSAPIGGKGGTGGSGSTGVLGGAGGVSGVGGNGGTGATVAATPPVISLASASIFGRDGHDVRFHVTGTDSGSDALGIQVELQTADGAPVSAFDSNFDGVLDSSSGRLLFNPPVTATAFDATWVLPGGAAANPGKALISVVDTHGGSSAVQEVTVDPQPSLPSGESCDPKLVQNRCESGLSCSAGADPRCQAGVSPTLGRVSYLHSATGTRLLVEGADPDGDINLLHIDFLDSAGAPKLVNMSGEESPDWRNQFEVTPIASDITGKFFISNLFGSGFETQAPKLDVKALDGASHETAVVRVSITEMVAGTAGANCDLRGYSGCATGLICVPGASGSKCQTVATAHTASCAAAPMLDPGTGASIWAGWPGAASLWEPPAGCLAADLGSRPEVLVRLHLSSQAAHLVISTETPSTHGDTLLYLVPGCPTAATNINWCADNISATDVASRLSLTNVPAGDYVVIAESISIPSDSIGITVSTQ